MEVVFPLIKFKTWLVLRVGCQGFLDRVWGVSEADTARCAPSRHFLDYPMLCL